MAVIKEITNPGKKVEKREHLCSAGNANWCSHYGNSAEVSSEPKELLPGASMRNPTRDKVMREEADIRKDVIRLQEFPLAFPEHVPPKPKICRPLYSAFPLF